MDGTSPGGRAVPHQPVAPDTPAVELERLALQEATHPEARPLVIQALIWLLRASSAALADQADELRAVDLSPSGFNVLQALRNTPGRELEPCEIAERLLLSRPSVTGLIDTLEGKGLVERRRHPRDRRRVLIALTEVAVALLEAHYPEHYARQNAVFAALSDDELATLVTLLRKVAGATPAHLDEDG
ncbi:MAG: MarR family transcriptional regulator [Egibacteraceae bacterium]